jgi:hypothetical protein
MPHHVGKDARCLLRRQRFDAVLGRLSGRLRQFRNVSSYEAIFLSLGERMSSYGVTVSNGSHRATGLQFSSMNSLSIS